MSAHIYIPVHFDGKAFVPDEPVDLPVDQPAVVRLVNNSARQSKTSEQRRAALRELLDMMRGAPEIPLEATQRSRDITGQ